MIALALLGCPAPPPPDAAGGLLTADPGRVEVLAVAPATRPRPLPERVPLALRRGAAAGEWTVRLPRRAVFYGQRGARQPPGMALLDGDRALPLLEAGAEGPGWRIRDGQITVLLPPEHPGRGLSLIPGSLRADELELDRRTSTAPDDRSFVVRTQPIHRDRRAGFYLPAPSAVRVEVEVPPGGVFETTAWLLPPAIEDAGRSTGASLQVAVVADGRREELVTLEVPVESTRIRVDLGRWSGRTIALELSTDPRGSPDFDHVFLEAPAVFAPSPAPRRVVLLMVDTLRADALGVYGYGRDTSPAIDAWARGAAVFEQCRSPAPWTLPSSQALLSGRLPERWSAGALAGERFAEAGFVTASISTNMYLGTDFGLAEGWTHQESYAPQAAHAGLERASALLERYPDRDLFLFLHFMDPHLPYAERAEHRSRWAGSAPAGLPISPGHPELEAAWQAADAAGRAAIERWTRDRYDQNVRQVDQAFGELLGLVGPDAWVVLVSDHGEMFWEEGTFGHGQSLHEGLVHVPFVIAGPGVVPGRSTVPATLADVVPTLAELVGADGAGLDGRSLVPTLQGRPQEAVDQGLGRILFGDAGWAVVGDGQRYTTRGGVEALAALDGSPAPSAPLDPWRERLGEALGRPVVPVTRFAFAEGGIGIGDPGVSWALERPDAAGRVWGREDPAGALGGPFVAPGGRVEVRRPKPGVMAPREVFVEGPVVGGRVELAIGEQRFEGVIGEQPTWVGPEGMGLRVDRSWQPAPFGAAGEVREIGEDVRRELEALGYVE